MEEIQSPIVFRPGQLSAPSPKVGPLYLYHRYHLPPPRLYSNLHYLSKKKKKKLHYN